MSSDDAASAAADCVSAKTLPFAKVCDALEFIDKKTSSTGKTNVREVCQEALKKLFNRWRDLARHGSDPSDSIFHLIRLLLPHLDRERSPYNLKEQKLARFLIELLSISKTSNDAVNLLNYKAPKGPGGGGTAAKSDFASMVFHVLDKRAECPKASTMSVADINQQLDAFAKSQQEGAQGKGLSSSEFYVFLKSLSARDMKWLLRIILKDLKIKMGHRSIFNAFHPDADDFFNMNSSLRKLSSTLSDPLKRLCEIEIEMFTPFKPMLAEKCESVNDVEKKMNNGEFIMETKLDGERVQIHKNGNDYRYFSRNNFDISDHFGKTSNDGSLSRHINVAFKSSVTSVILDGEMISHDASTGARVSKAASLDVKSLRDGAAGPQPCFFVFDILYLNGKVLTSRPLKERLQTLNRDVFEPLDGRIMHVNRVKGRSKENAMDFFNDAIDTREEGIIVKAANSHYQVNSRKGGWLKLKPEYVDSLTETFDLVIVGGYFGAGSRGGVSILTHFLLALLHDSDDGETRQFHTVCRIGSGYTFLELQELNNTLKNSFVRNTGDHSRPKNVLATSKGKGKPDVWIKPEKSVVVEVKAAELIESDTFYVGYTLRFPRLQYFRKDKGVDDAMTTTEFKSLQSRNAGKITTGIVTSSQRSSPPRKRKRTRAGLVISPAKRLLAAPFDAPDLNRVVKSSDAFGGKEFVILNDPPGLADASSISPLKKKKLATSTSPSKPYHISRAALQVRVKELGGDISQNPTRTTYCVASFTSQDLRTKNLAAMGKYLIVKGDWLCRSVAAGQLLPLSPLDCLHATDDVLDSFAQKFDKFGDAFDDDVDREKLVEIVENMKEVVVADDDVEEDDDISLLKDRLWEDSRFAIFHGKNFYVDIFQRLEETSTKIINSRLEISTIDIVRFGGNVSDKLDDGVTHVVCEDIERAEAFRKIRREREKKFHLVTSSWIDESIEERRLKVERLYEPF